MFPWRLSVQLGVESTRNLCLDVAGQKEYEPSHNVGTLGLMGFLFPVGLQKNIAMKTRQTEAWGLVFHERTE